MLWIRRNLSTASTVYVLTDRLDKHCIDAEPMLDKKAGSSQNEVFAHPVLWICRRFSTVELIFKVVLSFLHANRLRQQDAIQVLDATPASCSFCRQNGCRAELALAVRRAVGMSPLFFFFCRQTAFALRRPCRQSCGAKCFLKPRRFSFFS